MINSYSFFLKIWSTIDKYTPGPRLINFGKNPKIHSVQLITYNSPSAKCEICTKWMIGWTSWIN